MCRRHKYGLLRQSAFPCVVFFIGALLNSALAISCDPLVQREGILVKCTAGASLSPSSSQNPSSAIDCHDHSSRIPEATVARYACDLPFYLPFQAGAGAGQSSRDRALTCNSQGKWSGGLSRFNLFSCTMNCGVTDMKPLMNFVQKGTVTKQSDWPWHDAIFQRNKRDNEFHYICGGSLFKPPGAKEFFVLTAAHCFTLAPRPGSKVQSDDFRLVLGCEQPKFEHVHQHSPDAQVFRIAGFGLYDETVFGISQDLRRATIPIVEPDQCSEWNTRKLNPHEFCAGTDNLQNACNGDSGGGMVLNGTGTTTTGIALDSGARFYLYGIVSHGRGVWDGKPVACDTYTVFTKVSGFMDWILEVTERAEESSPAAGWIPASPSSSPPYINSTTTTTTSTTSRSEPPLQPTTPKQAPPSSPRPSPSTTRTPSPTFECGRADQGRFSTFYANEVTSDPMDYPWHATIFFRLAPNRFVYLCGGSLVRPFRGKNLVILTSAKCFDFYGTNSKSDIRVALGLKEKSLDGVGRHSPEAQIFQIRRLMTHESNLALIILDESVPIKNSFEPVCLGQSADYPLVGDVGYEVGFNPAALSSGGLRRFRFTVISEQECVPSTNSWEFCVKSHNTFTSLANTRGEGVVYRRVDEHGVVRFYIDGVSTYFSGQLVRTRPYTYHELAAKVGLCIPWIYETLNDNSDHGGVHQDGQGGDTAFGSLAKLLNQLIPG